MLFPCSNPQDCFKLPADHRNLHIDTTMKQVNVWCFLLHIKRSTEREQKPQQQATGGEGRASYFRTASKERVQADGSTKQVDSKKLTGNLPRPDTPPVACFHYLEGATIRCDN